MNHIPTDEYRMIIQRMPVLCVDIIVKNQGGDFLLIERRNPPMADLWWVVGGRVLKGEKLRDAAVRKISEEVGLNVTELRPVGYFECVTQLNPFGDVEEYHADSVVFEALWD